jgi:enoyl-CoA hydratase/carnithine racemase
MNEHVRMVIEERVLCITLNRPEKKNALTQEMYSAMTAALEEAAGSDNVRAVLITGSGDSYTSGNDIKDFQRPSSGQSGPGASGFGDRLLRLQKPVVAAVNGLAVGIGATMLLHCDLVYAVRDARFRFPFVDLGLVPELASSLLLPRLAGYHRAAELVLLGDFFTANEAKEIGLVNRVLPPAALLDHATGAAKALARKPPEALAQTRALLRGDLAPLLARKQQESEIFEQRRRSPEAQAIFAAFMVRSGR